MPTARRKSCKRGNPGRKLTKRVIRGGGNKHAVDAPSRERVSYWGSQPDAPKSNKGKRIFGGLRNWVSSKLTKKKPQEPNSPFGNNKNPVTKKNPLGNLGNNTFNERKLVGGEFENYIAGPGERIQSGQRRGNMVFNAVNSTSTLKELPIQKPPTAEKRQLEAEIQQEIQAAQVAGYMRRAGAGKANQMKQAAAKRRAAAAAVPSVSLQPTAVTSQPVEPPKGGLRRMGAFTGGKFSASAARAGMYLPPPPVAIEA